MNCAGSGSPTGMTMLDLQPATEEVVRVLEGVHDDDLARPTPCAGTPVAALLDHFMGLSLAFTMAARKTPPPGGSTPPQSAAEHLDPNWRKELPDRLRAL